MKFTIIESPFAGDMDTNRSYAQAAMKDCIDRGEIPFASHLLYPQVLDDTDPDQRKLGMMMGFQFMRVIAFSHSPTEKILAVYSDLGVSKGMMQGISEASALGFRVEERSIPWPK